MTAPDPDPARGFDDAPLEAAWTFRAILEAMSRPGRIQPLKSELEPSAPLHPASAAIALTLVDQDTVVWLDEPLSNLAVTSFLRFHCGCPITNVPGDAHFAFSADPARLPPLDVFPAGTPEYPDRAATLIVQCSSLGERDDVVLSGPGIETTQGLSVPSISLEFWHQLKASNARYPLGVDVVFASAFEIAACPRSVTLDMAEAA